MRTKEPNYVLIFLVVILAFLSMSYWAAAMEGPTGGVFGIRGIEVFGLNINADMWIFFVMSPLFLLLPLLVYGFESKLIGALASGFFIGSMLEDFFWFVVNPYYGIGKFNSAHATWLTWIDLGLFEIPSLYPVSIALAILSWYIFVKNSERTNKLIKNFQRNRKII